MNTFKVMEEFFDGNTCWNGYVYAIVKDKNGVYVRDEKIQGIDPETFKAVGAGLYEDKIRYRPKKLRTLRSCGQSKNF